MEWLSSRHSREKERVRKWFTTRYSLLPLPALLAMSYITSDGSATGFGEEPVRADTYWLRQPHHARVTFFFLVLHSPSQVCVGHSSPQRSLDYVTRHVKGFFTRENVFCEDRVRVCLGMWSDRNHPALVWENDVIVIDSHSIHGPASATSIPCC